MTLTIVDIFQEEPTDAGDGRCGHDSKHGRSKHDGYGRGAKHGDHDDHENDSVCLDAPGTNTSVLRMGRGMGRTCVDQGRLFDSTLCPKRHGHCRRRPR